MTESNPLIFYDIASTIEPRSFAPNPSKARLALSFKDVPFKTKFVDVLDIPTVRKGLNCAPVRKLDDGSDFYTLPIVQEPVSGTVLGDSFLIALYLEENFPNSGAGTLFPTDSAPFLDYESPAKDTPFLVPLTILQGVKHSKYANFNVHIDATFTASTVLFAPFMPFKPETADAIKTMMAKRAHLPSWDVLNIQGEARQGLMVAFKESLTSLAQLYMLHESGPYLEGEKANYADLIVGGWLNAFASTIPKEEWAEIATWHNGVFGRLHDALQANYFKCT